MVYNYISIAINDGSFDGVKAALQAGADVNRHPGQACAPIVTATLAKDAGMLDFLLEQGADPDRPVTEELSSVCSNTAAAVPGDRALHIAAKNRDVEILRLLLKRGRTNPNVTNNKGCTPLMVASESSHDCVKVLLEAGADPALAEERGYVPFHAVARNDYVDLVDMLYSRAPATLNHCAAEGQTPLFLACLYGHESMVSKLLSLGAMQAMQAMPPDECNECPLLAAISEGFVDVVWVPISEGGIRAIGGDVALTHALHGAAHCRQARILRLLPALDGEERRSEWASIDIGGTSLLHNGAGSCCPAAVSILLEAGADEAAYDTEGRIPRDAIGVFTCLDLDGEPQMDQGEEVAIRRMLQRGPAYRARSWAWPSDEEADAGGSDDGGTAAAAADAAALSSPPALKTPPVVGVRILRPKEKSSRKFFARLIGRYCANN